MDTVNKHNDFVQEYKQEFENDLNPDSRNFPATLAELTEKLKAWKTILQVDSSCNRISSGALCLFYMVPCLPVFFRLVILVVSNPLMSFLSAACSQRCSLRVDCRSAQMTSLHSFA